ncbi:MAG: hypothetical protein CMJ18_09470 [Phycisphaeraceae bacterium]|nr:hypothetical protein [Phycisphaeraceae bacterium]
MTDANDGDDVFLYDVNGGTLELISVSFGSPGTAATDRSLFPSIGADGRFVTFISQADDLLAPGLDLSAVSSVFLADTSNDGTMVDITGSLNDVVAGTFITGQDFLAAERQVRNLGPVAIPDGSSYDTRLLLSLDNIVGNGDDLILATINDDEGLGPFEIGEPEPLIQLLGGTAPGDYFLAAIFDVNDDLDESNETNNTFITDTAVISVVAPPEDGVIVNDFEDGLLGPWMSVAESPAVIGDDGTGGGNLVAILPEGSDSAIERRVRLSDSIESMSLDYRFTTTGIDDEIVVTLNDDGNVTELFRERSADFVGAPVFASTGPIDITPFAGRVVSLEVRLASDDADPTAVLQVDNIALIDDLLIRFLIGDGQDAKSLSYIEDDGTKATITFDGGTALVGVTGDGIPDPATLAAQRRMFVIPDTATDVEVHLVEITVDPQARAARRKLTIKGKGGDDGVVTVRGMVDADGGLNRIDGKTARFEDIEILVDGPLKQFTGDDVTDATLTIQNLGDDDTVAKIQFANAQNFIVSSQGAVDLKGDSYLNDDAVNDGVTATYVKKIGIKENAAFALFATGMDAKGVSVGTAKMKDLLGGFWTAPGDGKTLNAASISGWVLAFGGMFPVIRSKGASPGRTCWRSGRSRSTRGAVSARRPSTSTS